MTDTSRPELFNGTGRHLGWLLTEQANRRGDHAFIRWEPFDGPRRTWTYSEFAHEVGRLIGGLRRRGVGRGDRVIIHTDNSPEFLMSWWALTTMGAVAVCTNTKSSLDEMSYFASHSGARGAITQPRYAELLNGSMPSDCWVAVTTTDAGDVPRVGTAPDADSSFDRLFAAEPDEFATDVDAMDHASIQYTSGTTSRPKAVVWTHANCLWAGRVSGSHLAVSPETITLLHLPLFHTNAMSYSMLSTVWAGGTVVVMPRFSASRFWDVVVRNDINWTAMIQFTSKAIENLEVPEHKVRIMGNGSTIPRYEQKFGVNMVGWWGMTETVSHPIVGDPWGRNRGGSCGRPAPEYGVRILRDTGEPVGWDEPGELRIQGVRGVSLFAEYLHDPAATAAAFDEDGWLRTGDRVSVSADGYITFHDRDKDMLKIGAENVAASEIERVIAEVPGVFEVAVVAGPHPMLDEVPVAFVIKHADATGDLSEAIDVACKAKLAAFKVPHSIRFVDELPRSTLNKVAKAELRKLVR